MPTTQRNQVRAHVLSYVRNQTAPVRFRCMAEDLRKQIPAFDKVRESDLLGVVQSMIVTGKLSYAPGLKIQLGPTLT